MVILIMGPQGSGKGTQAKKLAQELGLFYLDAGALLRRIAKTDTRINEIVNQRGALIPDDEIFTIITSFLEEKGIYDEIVFDGYPRSIKQYELIDQWLARKGAKIIGAVLLRISTDEAVKRLSSRRLDTKTGKVYNLISNPPPAEIEGRLVQREDDRPETILERLRFYQESTEPLVRKLKSESMLVELDGERPIEAVYGELKETLEKFKNEETRDKDAG